MRTKIARSVAMGLVGLLIQQGSGAAFGPPPEKPPTATPIKHLVVIFQENFSFDHYFGTYPVAANPAGEPPFQAKPWTPNVNGLSGALLTNNPNFLKSLNNSSSNTGGAPGAALNPFRLDRSQAATSDQNHDYGPEQAAADSGLMDLFPFDVGVAGPLPSNQKNEIPGLAASRTRRRGAECRCREPSLPLPRCVGIRYDYHVLTPYGFHTVNKVQISRRPRLR